MLPSTLLPPHPKTVHFPIWHVIKLISVGEKEYQKRNSLLPLKIPHKFNLMGMDILQGKIVRIALLRVKTDRNPLYHTDIIHCTLLLKISQRYMPALFIYADRCNRGGDLLYQGKILLPVAGTGLIDKLLQRRTAQASGIPGRISIPPQFLSYP